eukprot:9343576-Pyramimonas_sp.AAC.1
MPEAPDQRARSPCVRSSEGGGPRAPRPRLEASDLSNQPGRPSAFSMRIDAKRAHFWPRCTVIPETRCPGALGQ